MSETFLLDLTLKQQAILHELFTLEANKVLSIRFTDHTKDHNQIRGIVHLQGGMSMIEYLLKFDQQLLEQQEQSKSALLAEQGIGLQSSNSVDF